jgi:hypothetical protein
VSLRIAAFREQESARRFGVVPATLTLRGRQGIDSFSSACTSHTSTPEPDRRTAFRDAGGFSRRDVDDEEVSSLTSPSRRSCSRQATRFQQDSSRPRGRVAVPCRRRWPRTGAPRGPPISRPIIVTSDWCLQVEDPSEAHAMSLPWFTAPLPPRTPGCGAPRARSTPR